ncbi:MAG: UDP-N-acetylmuramate dehydrogenase [Rickettsiales bacterium]
MSKFFTNYKLANLTWFKTGGNAENFFIPNTEEELIFALKNNYCIDANNKKHYLFQDNIRNISILGACSNILIHDFGIKGLVIKLGHELSSIKLDSSNKLIYVKAGCMNYSIANFCMRYGILGFEFLIGIPGTAGGGAFMNAGAYSKEYKDILSDNFYAIKCIDFYGNIKFFTKEECNFNYRSSIFQKLKNYIIIEVIFQYKDIDIDYVPIIQEKISHIKEERKKTQPITDKTCGSTFANHINIPAWKIIDNLGLRGFKFGGAAISTKHANFIINESSASSNDIFQLICLIKKLAFEKLNINLQTEIQFLGFNKEELKDIYIDNY